MNGAILTVQFQKDGEGYIHLDTYKVGPCFGLKPYILNTIIFGIYVKFREGGGVNLSRFCINLIFLFETCVK